MEVEEVETTADPGAGPHIETKKWKRAVMNNFYLLFIT